MENAQHGLDGKARRRQQFGQLRSVELAGVERVDRGVASRREGDPVRRGHQQRTAGPQDAKALGHELPLIPEMFDHLEVDDHINVPVGHWQLGQIPMPHLHRVTSGVAILHNRFAPNYLVRSPRLLP